MWCLWLGEEVAEGRRGPSTRAVLAALGPPHGGGWEQGTVPVCTLSFASESC